MNLIKRKILRPTNLLVPAPQFSGMRLFSICVFVGFGWLVPVHAVTVDVASGSNLDATYSLTSGSDGLTKTGAGTLIIWNPQSYTGTTAISAGQIMIGGTGSISSASDLQVSSGASINLTGWYAPGDINRTFAGLTGAGVVYGGGGTVTINKVSGSDTFSGDIQGAQGFIKDGAGTLVLSGSNNYTGGTLVSGGTLALHGGSVKGGITNNANVSITADLANAVSGTGSLTKNGSGTAFLWTANSYTGATIVNAGQIALGGAGAISSSSAVQIASGASINLTGDWAPNNINRTIGGLTGAGILYGGGGTVTVNKTSGTDTFGGNIQGAQGLIKSGAGTLVLTAANSYTGGTTVSGGTLALHGGSVTGAITNNANVSITGDLATTVSGSGTLTKTGAAEAYLWNGNTYTGATVVEAGTLTLGGAGAISGSSALQINSGAAVNLTGMWAANNINRTVSGLTGAGVLYGGGGTVTINKVSGSDTFSGDIQGAQGLVKSGAGTLVLSGANSYTGGTTISAGTLDLNGGSVVGGIVNNGNLVIRDALANAVSGSGSLTKTGAAEAYLWSANSYTGATVVEAGTLTLGGIGAISESSALQINSGAAVNLTGMYAYNNINRTVAGLNGAGVLYGWGGTVTVNKASGTDTFTGDIQGGQGLVKSGAGTLALGGASSYTGATTVNAGILTVAHGSALGSTAGGTVVNSGGQLRLNSTSGGITVGNEALTISGTGFAGDTGGALRNAAGNNTYQGRITLAGDANIGAANGTSLTLDVASGNAIEANNFNLTLLGAGSHLVNDAINLGSGGLTKTGTGTATLNGTLGAGSLNVNQGTLALGSAGRLAAGAVANVSGGTLSTGGNETITRLNATGGTVNLTGDVLTVTGSGANKSTVGSSATLTGGSISVQGALDYQATSGSTALSVASGGTLSGSGTTSGTLAVSGNLAPGNSTGTLNVGNTTFLSGGKYTWEIDDFSGLVGTNWDFLNITGNLDITAGTGAGSQFLIDVVSLLSAGDTSGLASNFTDSLNYSFAIATASGTINNYDAGKFLINTAGFQNAFTGTWGTSLSGDGKSLNITYTAATAIPEPSTGVLFLSALGILAVRRRFSVK